MTPFNKPSMISTWDTEIQCVQLQGIGFIQGQDYRTGMDKGLALLIEKKATRWLANMKAQNVISLTDQDWTFEDWTPRAVKAGLRHSAFVIPTNVLTQMALKRMLTKVGDKEIVMAYFDDLEAAKVWLRST